jgi:aminobenzoyl-glutamate transport protein
MASNTASPGEQSGGGMQGVLNWIEKVGNKVPHPVLMFLYLIGFIIVLSGILDLFGTEVTELIAVPVPVEHVPSYYEDSSQPMYESAEDIDPQFELVETTIPINSMMSGDGVRFIFSTFVSNFQGFGVVAVTFIAMMGAGAAEGAGLMGALIRKLVSAAPVGLITFLIVLVGALSSIASDAGYLILIPLAASAFVALGRNPLAGMAAGFAGVAGTFAANVIPQPIDAMMVEVANEAIALAGGEPIGVVSNYYFTAVSMFAMCIVITLVTEKLIEPRLGKFDPADADPDAIEEELDAESRTAEAKGLRYALFGFLAVLAVVLVFTIPSGAPLRDPVTGDIIGTTPFMDSLLFIITLFFLISGIAYGIGAGTVKSANDVIGFITKTFSGLAGLVFMLLMIAQFIAYFNYTNMPRVAAVAMADLLERSGIAALPLLIGFIIVILILDFIIPGVIPKWAIFAPVFIPIFMRLDVAPQTVLAAYRIGDSPVNTLTPLMVYLPFIVTIAQKYNRKSGIGTIISLMLPYAIAIAVTWTLLFVVWFLLDIPLGPGYPIAN